MDEELAVMWENLVARGVPKDEATRRVQASPGFNGTGAGGSWAPQGSGSAPTRVARTAVQGATLGWGDEAEGVVGALRALVPGGQSPRQAYRAATDEARADVRDFRTDNPVAGTAIEIAAGLPIGVAALGRRAATTAARPASTLIQRTVDAVRRVGARPAAQGAAAGAVAGAGVGEGTEDRIGGAVSGAAVGGGVGAVLGAVTRPFSGTARAQDRVVGAVQRSGASGLREAAESARPGETLMDVGGDQVRRLARGVESIPSAGSSQIRTALNQRADAAPERIASALQREAGRTFENAAETRAGMTAQRKATGNELYEPAFARGRVEDPEIANLFQSKPSLQVAYRRAQETAAEEGVALAPLDALDVRTIHMVKEELDDLIRRAKRSADQSSPSARNTRAMLQTRDALLSRLEADDVVPEYGVARRQFGGDAANEDAFDAAINGDRDLGLKKFTNEDPNKIRHFLGRVSESERDYYRRSAFDLIRQEMAGTADGRDLTKVIFGSPEMRERVSALFPDDEAFKRFAREMETERGMADTRNAVLGGPATSRIDADREDIVGRAFRLSDVLHPKETATRLVDAGVARVQAGGGEAAANRIAPMLTAKDDDLKRLVEVLEAFDAKQKSRRALTSGASRMAGVAGGLSGRDDR